MILEIIGSGAPGGGTTVVLDLCRGLAERGVAVGLASQRDSYIVREAAKSGIRVFELDFAKRRSGPSIAAALNRVMANNNITLAHAHGARAALPLALLPALSRPRFVYTVHGFHYPSKSIALRQAARYAEYVCIRRSVMTLFVSCQDKNRAIADKILSPARSSKVIYNGSQAVEWPAAGQYEKRFDIAFLGRLHFQKNPLIIPDILAAMRPRRPTIAIIGNGDKEQDLRKRVTEAGLDAQVTFFGECSHARGLEILAQTKLLLLPSLNEGLPMAVIEAMHRCIPVVASRVGGLPELVEHGETGILVEPQDTAGFARGLATLLGDEDLRRRMGSRARDRATALFSADEKVDAHIAVYEQLLGSRIPMGHDRAAA